MMLMMKLQNEDRIYHAKTSEQSGLDAKTHWGVRTTVA